MTRVLVSQDDNFAANFGLVYRASALFYYRYDSRFRTTISFMDYWYVKRGVEVAVVASLRDLDGTLLDRRPIEFGDGMVINYRPVVEGVDAFEGSVEIEVFAATNLVIPYSAMVAVYEAPTSISHVHSYARCYSAHELEEGRTIPEASESCWTIRDSDTVQSIGYFHNGGRGLGPQTAILSVVNHSGQARRAEIELPDLAPYQTIEVVPSEHLDGLAEFLGGEPGNAALSFQLADAFSRMLVGNRSIDGTEFQITHSNFNYEVLDPGTIDGDDAAYLHVPSCGLQGKQVTIYPDSDPGRYRASHPEGEVEYHSGHPVWFQLDEGLVEVEKLDDALPARVVTGLSWAADDSKLPFECSLGVINSHQPVKRFWWGCCAAGPTVRSKLIIHDLEPIYGGIPEGTPITITLYSAKSKETATVELSSTQLAELDGGVFLDELCPDAVELFGDDFGYYTMFCEYGGLTCYGLLIDGHGSMTLEHGF